MVSKTEEAQVNRLENQVDNGGGGAWEYLCLVRKLKLRRSDKVLKHGLSILNDPSKRSSLGPEVVDEFNTMQLALYLHGEKMAVWRQPRTSSSPSERDTGLAMVDLTLDLLCSNPEKRGHGYGHGHRHATRDTTRTCRHANFKKMQDTIQWTLYELVAIAAMDCQCLDVAKDCIKVLQKKFPDSKRVGRLEAMLLEAKGLWAEAEKAYSSLLEDNPLDQVIHKRRAAMAKAQGHLLGAIEWLNKYLEIFMADHDAWRELAEIYVSLQMYKQAAFCYEELILSQPTNPLYHLAYADVLYTLGGLENLQTAKKYYASAIDLTGGKNTRALYGICLCTFGIGQLTKGRNKDDKENSELQSLAVTALEKDYKQTAPGNLSLLSSTLRSLKLSS